MLLQLVEAILVNISVAESIDANVLHITFIWRNHFKSDHDMG